MQEYYVGNLYLQYIFELRYNQYNFQYLDEIHCPLCNITFEQHNYQTNEEYRNNIIINTPLLCVVW